MKVSFTDKLEQLKEKIANDIDQSWLNINIPEEIKGELLIVKTSHLSNIERYFDLNQIKYKVLNTNFKAQNIHINEIHRYTKPKVLNDNNAAKEIKDAITRLEKEIYTKDNIRRKSKTITNDISLQKIKSDLSNLRQILNTGSYNQVILSNFHRSNTYFQIQLTYSKGDITTRKVCHLSPKRTNIVVVENKRDYNKVDPEELLKEYKRIQLPNCLEDLYIPSDAIESCKSIPKAM